MAEKKNPPGPVGDRVCEQVRLLRERRGMTYRKLSDRLQELGRPIPPLGLSRLEAGERRVDADDLIALALALDVNVTRLMFDVEAAGHGTLPVELTPEVSAPFEQALNWATGTAPLSGRGPRPSQGQWEQENQPIWQLETRQSPADQAARVVLEMIDGFLVQDEAADKYTPLRAIRSAVDWLSAEVSRLEATHGVS